MKIGKRSLYGALAGCLLAPGASMAQSSLDPNWVDKLLPARTRPAATTSATSPYNPNFVPAPATGEKTPLVRVAYYGDNGTPFNPTPLPGLRMLFQGDSATKGGLASTAPNYQQAAVPQQPPAMPTAMTGSAVPPVTTLPYPAAAGTPVILPSLTTGSPAAPTAGTVIGSDGVPLGTPVQPGTKIQPGAPTTTATTVPGSVPYVPSNGMVVQQGVVVQQGIPQTGFIRKGRPTFLQEVMGTDDGSCNIPCDPACGPAGRFWVSAEYAWVWNKGMHVPPLVTSSPAGQPVTTAGTLGDPNTTVLYPTKNLGNEGQSGFRLRAGFWFDCQNTCGVDFGGLFVPSHKQSFFAGSAGDPGLFRPFTNAATGTQFTQLVAFQDPSTGVLTPVLAGSTRVQSTSESYTGDVNFRKNLCCGPCSRIDLLLGYRYFHLKEGIEIEENLVATDPNGARAPLGTTFVVQDKFRTTNDFHGGQIGLAGEYRYGKWFLDYTGKVAVGNMNSNTQINGVTVATVNGVSTAGVGGLLALPSNIGSYTRNKLAFLPEGGLTLGYQVTSGVRVYAGYNFLYASTVMRPGNQIDTTVNTTQIPPGTLVGAARPTFLNHSTDFWQQTVSAGIEFRF